MSLSCGIAAETWLRIPRKRTGEDHTLIIITMMMMMIIIIIIIAIDNLTTLWLKK